MWFAKWFGGRKDEHEDDEPARFSAPPAVIKATSSPAPKPTSVVTPAQKKKGFDPYNSGAFERRNAWERTNLR
jgi:hypothetical protein